MEDAQRKSDILMRGIESEVEQLHGTVQKTLIHLMKTNQELKIIKWCMFFVAVMMGLIAWRSGALFNLFQ